MHLLLLFHQMIRNSPLKQHWQYTSNNKNRKQNAIRHFKPYRPRSRKLLRFPQVNTRGQQRLLWGTAIKRRARDERGRSRASYRFRSTFISSGVRHKIQNLLILLRWVQMCASGISPGRHGDTWMSTLMPIIDFQSEEKDRLRCLSPANVRKPPGLSWSWGSLCHTPARTCWRGAADQCGPPRIKGVVSIIVF